MTSIITYGQMKTYYNQYIQENAQKSKENLSRREAFDLYAKELNMIGPLIRRAKTEGTKKELEGFIQRQAVLVKLLEDMGFQVELMDN